MRKIFNAAVVAAILIFASSCIKEKQLDEGIAGKTDAAEVILRLKTPGGFSSPQSRSLTNAQENTIDNIYVLVFDKDNNLAAIKPGEEVDYAVGSADPRYSGTGSFSVTLAPSRTNEDKYNLVVLANAETILTNTIGLNLSAITDKSYSTVTAAIWTAIGGAMYPSGGTIPMWGESGPLVIEPGGENQNLTLTRSVARIDVGVGVPTKDGDTDLWSWSGKNGDGNTIPFALTEVYVIRPNDHYAVIPNKTLAAGTPTIPAGTAAFSFDDSEDKFAFNGLGGFTSRDIYVPEADILMGTGGEPGDVNHENRMAVVVGGSYNGGGTTYYRLDFAKDGDLLNVLRNHLYQFNISGVSGAGYPDVETAYKSLAMNMTAEILEWNETELNEIKFDGQYYLGVNKSSFEFTREGRGDNDEDNVLIIKTDYPTWTATAYGDANATIAVPNDAITGNAWLRVSPTSGIGIASPTHILLELDENNSGAVRIAYINIEAGRLSYQIKVTQTLSMDLSLILRHPLTLSEVQEYGWVITPGQTPEDFNFEMLWGPRSADVHVVNNGDFIFDMTSEYDSFVSGNSTISTYSGSETYRIRPQTVTSNMLGEEIYDKTSSIDFIVNNGISSIKKTLVLRQYMYDLIPADVIGGYAGNVVYAKLKTNTNWVAEIITGADQIKSFTQSGSANMSGADFIYEFSSLAIVSGVTITFKFSSPEGLFEDKLVSIKTGMSYAFARSNIVSINGRLTFAITEDDNKIIPANSQGCHFKYGSLLAISANTSVFNTSHIIFNPSNTTPSNWATIPDMSGVTASTNEDYDIFKGVYPVYGYDESAGTGDICRYISDKNWVEGRWRIPTAFELRELYNETTAMTSTMKGVKFGSFGSTTISGSGGTDQKYGFHQMTSGWLIGIDAHNQDDSENMTIPSTGRVFFPAGGNRDTETGNFANVGQVGFARSSSAPTATTTYYLRMSGTLNEIYSGSRTNAIGIRCIRDRGN